MTPQGAIARALLRAQWQSTLFGQPNRARLAECEAEWSCRSLRVIVHRNHAIEPVTSVAPPYAAWNGLAYDWSIGSYDDSLSFDGNADADVHLVWLDTGRLSGLAGDDLSSWLCGRLRALRARTTSPIVVLAWPFPSAVRAAIDSAEISGIHLCDLESLATELDTQWLDLRAETISGTRLSNRACLAVARELACRWLPAALLPPMKCVAVDLDGTLYDGVLGEDGATGLVFTEAHRALQQYLADLGKAGMLLALVSRNEPADVEAMFAARTDFPLRRDDFSAIELSWGDKASALERIAHRLRIGLDAIVLADDNPGELATVAASTSTVTVHAGPDARQTVAALSHVAGVFQWRASDEDRLRADDLRASEERESVRDASISSDEYLRSLEIRLKYFVGAGEHFARVCDLVRKTNQFNLSLRRLNETEIAQRLEEHSGNVIAIGLSDRLSDSGIIGAVVGRCRDGVLLVEEMSVSCRALGRRLEDDMLTRALWLMAEGRSPAGVSFEVRVGPRNAPAREWLAAYVGHEPADARAVAMPYATVAAKLLSDAVAISVRHPEAVS